jgi:hypothetical protein
MKPCPSFVLSLSALFTVSLTLANVNAATPKTVAKPRIVVMTDIGGDPDDRQSMVRFLAYACDFDVEGLCTGFGWGHDKITRPNLIRDAVKAYGQVLPNLRKHRSDYPSAERLAGLIKDGDNRPVAVAGLAVLQTLHLRPANRPCSQRRWAHPSLLR